MDIQLRLRELVEKFRDVHSDSDYYVDPDELLALIKQAAKLGAAAAKVRSSFKDETINVTTGKVTNKTTDDAVNSERDSQREAINKLIAQIDSVTFTDKK